MATVIILLKVVLIGLALGAGIYLLNRRLGSYFAERPHLKFRFQLIQLGGALVAILFAILLMPFGDTLRGQLLQLYGLIISATIALSSTTLVGNVMAGLMLKAIGNCRPGYYITVGDYFGRISEMDLLHTEIQTEERDLTTLPNLYLITHPVRVMQTSGTLISVELSLGYDVSRHTIEKLLIEAARNTELESPFVQIRYLGDFSVTYQVSALLTDVNRLLDKRRELRARAMDALHDAGIEIVSPSFMNTRAQPENKTFIPSASRTEPVSTDSTSPDAIAFDKADKAESVEKLKESLKETEARIRACDEVIAKPSSEKAREAAQREREQLAVRAEKQTALITRAEQKISES